MKDRYLRNVVTLRFDAARCDGCGLCLEVCPRQVFAREGKAIAIVDRDACMECGACARNCHRGAVTVRAGVGCAYAILMSRLRRRGTCCGETCGCSLEEDPTA
ncbi:MAG: mercury methylation ferredoxin HgcB [bacterium]|nr:mercury methylation ferredoxin HgcB [bacterium]